MVYVSCLMIFPKQSRRRISHGIRANDHSIPGSRAMSLNRSENLARERGVLAEGQDANRDLRLF